MFISKNFDVFKFTWGPLIIKLLIPLDRDPTWNPRPQWHKLLKWLGIQSGKKIRLLLYLLNAYKYLAALRPDHGLIMLNPQFHTILYRA